MRIPSGTTTQYIYFVAVDATDFASRETGLSSFTVYRSRNGGASAQMTTPTINETDTTNMPGVYELLLNEDTTIGAGNDSEEMVLHITHAGMAPVTRTIELYRPKITAGNTLDVTATGAAGIDWGNVENASTSVDLSATSINLCDTVTTNTDMRGTDSALLAASVNVSGGVVEANLLQIGGVAQSATDLKDFADAGYDPATNKVQGVVLVDTVTTLTGHTAQSGDTYALANGATGFAAIHADTNSLDGTKIPDVISLANINAQADTALSDIGLQYLVNTALPTSWTANITANSALDYMADDGTATYDRTTDSLQAIADSGGGGPTAAQIADAVWTETLADHSGGAGSTAEALSNASSAGDPWATALPGAYGAGTAGKIVGDNINAPIGTVDTVVDAIKAVTDLIPDSGAMTSIATAAALTTVDTVVDAILVDTGTTLPATLTTIEGKVDTVDTVVDAILVDTGTTLPATLTTIESKVDTVDTVVDTLTTTIGTAGAGLTDLGGMSTTMKGQVNTEVVDVVFTDTDAELTTVPAANAPIGDKINFVYMLARNKVTQTATAQNLYRDDGTTAVGSGATVSDDTTTFTRDKFS